MQELPKPTSFMFSTPNPHKSITIENIQTDFTLTYMKPNPIPQQFSISLLLSFKNWLKSKTLSNITRKNYLSDVRLFLNWREEIRPLDRNRTSNVTSNDFNHYLLHLQNQKIPKSSLKRKTSSLKQFAKFLHLQFTSLPEDPIEYYLNSFRQHLKKRGHKSKTIINYLSDLKHYLTWYLKIKPLKL